MTILTGDEADNVLTGDAADDVINGAGGSDAIDGAGGNDNLYGGAGADTISGGEGDDFINVDDTLDTVDGGTGSDTLLLDFFGNATGVTVDLSAVLTGGVGTIQSDAGSGTVTAIEVLWDLNGSNFDDVLILGDLASVYGVNGRDGDDIITGGSADNSISGDAGDDSLFGGAGADGLDGGAGQDSLEGEQGDDFLTVTDTLDTVDGGTGSDFLLLDFFGNATGVTVDLSAVLTGGVGTIQSDAGSGTATAIEVLWDLNGSNFDDVLIMGDLASVYGVNGRDGDDIITGGSADNSISGDAGDDSLFGGAGADGLDGGAGQDSLEGEQGDDFLTVTDTLDTVDGGGGNDFFLLSLNASQSAVTVDLSTVLSGGTGTFQSDDGSGSVTAIEGLWDLDGSNFDDVLILGDLASVYGVNGLDGDDTITGGAADNTLSGDGGDDILIGGGGADILIGGAGADTLNGGQDNDYLQVTDTLDTVDGGDDDDLLLLDFYGSGGAVAVDLSDVLSGGTGTFQSDAGSGTVKDIEFLWAINGSDFDDVLVLGDLLSFNAVRGLDGDDTITGGAADNTLSGDGGNDVLSGEGGNDVLFGGTGADILDGGAGNDVLIVTDTLDWVDGGADSDSLSIDFTTFSTGVVLDLRGLWEGGDGTMKSSLGLRTLTNLESLLALTGSSFNDVLRIGNIAGLDIHGGDGDDRIRGKDMDDRLFGDGGRDDLSGRAGKDFLSGGGGNDLLAGGADADRLNGGEGADRFSYTSRHDSSGTTFDTIVDFDGSEDRFLFDFAVTGLDSLRDTGTLRSDRFDADLADVFSTLGAGHAGVFTADSGDMAGRTFIVIDANNKTGYQAGSDFLIELENALNLASLTLSDFN